MKVGFGGFRVITVLWRVMCRGVGSVIGLGGIGEICRRCYVVRLY